MKQLVRLTLCLSTLLVLTSAQATSFFRSGDDLEALGGALGVHGQTDKRLFANGYVAGVADAGAGQTWCPPAQISEEQIYHSVARYLQTHPEMLRREGAASVSEALASDYPCEKK